jgi:hypothetical protein
VASLAGRATLRLSTSTGNCHPSYFMLVPAVGIQISATRAGSNIAISFPTQPGVLYRVLCRDSLATGNWSLLTTVLGDGAARSALDPAVLTQRYYTVVAP